MAATAFHMISLRLEPLLYQWLCEHARTRDVSISSAVRSLLEEAQIRDQGLSCTRGQGEQAHEPSLV